MTDSISRLSKFLSHSQYDGRQIALNKYGNIPNGILEQHYYVYARAAIEARFPKYKISVEDTKRLIKEEKIPMRKKLPKLPKWYFDKWLRK
jgi:hypothetical protein